MTGLLLLTAATCLAPVPAGAQGAPPGLQAALDPAGVLPYLVEGEIRLWATTHGEGDTSDYKLLAPCETKTLFTLKGPALIHRIWSTSGFVLQSRLVVKLDGDTQVLWEKGDLPESQQPTRQTGADPLRAFDGKAYWSYVPLRVRRSAEFIATDLRLPELQKVTLEPSRPTPGPRPGMGFGRPAGTMGKMPPGAISPLDANGNKFYLQVEYSPGAGEVSEDRVQQVRARLKALIANPLLGISGPAGPGTTETGGPVTKQMVTVGQGAPLKLPMEDNCVVEAMVVDPGVATFDQLKATRLIIKPDAASGVCIDVPVPYLVGAYWKLDEYNGAFSAVKGNQLIFRLPMPVGKGMEIHLDRFGRGAPAASLQVTLVSRRLQTPAPYRLCAEYRSAISKRDQPMHMADVKGEGALVGVMLGVDGMEHLKFAFLEGNEQIYVDGAQKTTWEGTGTEDFFNNSWYFSSGPASRAFHGLPHFTEGPPPRCAAYRFLIADRIPFTKSLRFDFQHGSRNSAPDTLYKSVAFWYQKPPCKILAPAEAIKPKDEDTGQGGGVVEETKAPPDPITPTLLAILVAVGLAVVYKRYLKGKH